MTTPRPHDALRGHLLVDFLGDLLFPGILEAHPAHAFISFERELKQGLFQDRLHGVDREADVVADVVRVSPKPFVVGPRIGQY